MYYKFYFLFLKHQRIYAIFVNPTFYQSFHGHLNINTNGYRGQLKNICLLWMIYHRYSTKVSFNQWHVQWDNWLKWNLIGWRMLNSCARQNYLHVVDVMTNCITTPIYIILWKDITNEASVYHIIYIYEENQFHIHVHMTLYIFMDGYSELFPLFTMLVTLYDIFFGSFWCNRKFFWKKK